MVTLQELEALDLMLWLRSGTTVATLVDANQSSISRRSQRALQRFQARLRRQGQGWSIQTRLHVLLDLERRLHQQFRLHRQQGLRLNVPHWSQPPLRGCPLPGWVINPENGPLLCDNPLDLLRSHVIDACLITPTQVDAPQQDLALFEIYSTDIDLYEIAPTAAEKGGSDHGARPTMTLDILEQGRLLPPDFLPTTCRGSSLERFEDLCTQYGLPAPSSVPDSSRRHALAFLTPAMASRLERPRWLSLEIAWPYRESLAVLRANAEEPAVQLLLECLRSAFRGAVPVHATAAAHGA